MKAAVVRTIMRTRLVTVPDLPPVMWEQTEFVDPLTTYVEDEFRLGVTYPIANGTRQARPLYFLTIHSKKSDMLDELDRLADAFGNAFEPGRTLIDGAETHQLELLTFDAGALRRMPTGEGYRRCTVGLSATAFRTELLTA